MIVDFYIMEDYVNRKFPIIKLDLMFDTEMINSILEYEGKPLLKLEIYENILSSDDESLIDSRIYIKDTFSVIPKNEKTDFRILEDLDSLPDKDRLDAYSLFPVFLIKMDNVSYFTKGHSFVFKNCSKSDALKAILKMKDIPRGVVIASPPDTTKIDQIIIPQGDLISNINYLNNRYGLYKSVPIIYQDLFNLYCLCTYEPNIFMDEGADEYNVIFNIPDDRSDKLIKTGYDINKTKKTYEAQTSVLPIIKDFSQTASNIQFGTIMTVDKNGNVQKSTVDPSTSKLKFVYKDNDLTSDQTVNNNYASMKQIQIDITDISLRYFKPYKVYTLQYPQSLKNTYDVTGKHFMMTGINSTFVKNGGIFNLTSTITLKEIK